MLLNIPPRPDGTLDPRAVKTLKAIGAWLRVNGEAIMERARGSKQRMATPGSPARGTCST